MTPLEKAVHRVTRGALDGSYGPDRGRRLVATFNCGDTLILRPQGTRRPETVSLFDVYRFAIRCRAGREILERAREKKVRKAERLAYQRRMRAEKRLTTAP